MARPIQKSRNFIETGKGDYKNIAANLIDLLEKDMSFGENILHQRALNEYVIEAFHSCDPNGVLSEEESNALYAWVSGSSGEHTEVGQTSDLTGHCLKEVFFVNVEYRDWDRDRFAAQSRCHHIGHVIKESILANPDLRGFLNGGLRLDAVEFGRELVRSGGSVAMAETVQVRVTYHKVRKTTGRSDR